LIQKSSKQNTKHDEHTKNSKIVGKPLPMMGIIADLNISKIHDKTLENLQ